MPSMTRLIFLSVLTVVAAFFLEPIASHHVPDLRSKLPPSLQAYFPAPKVTSEFTDKHNGATPFMRKIVAVGDLHGDLPNALTVLQMAHVIDENSNWSGEIDIFVQTGDIVDRGDDTILLYDLMEKLRVQAHAAGGEVLSHLGNHEWMNVIGDWRYVFPSEIQTFGSVAARQKMIASGRIGRAWAQNYTTASRLPLHPSLGPSNTDYPSQDEHPKNSPLSHAALAFCHGGLAPEYPQILPYPSAINAISDSLLHKLQFQSPLPAPHPPNRYPGLPGATAEEARLYGSDGPLWYRGWAMDDEKTVCAAVDKVLQKIGSRRMIMGHTPNFEKIISRCDGKIIIIDTGISHVYGGALSALSVVFTLNPVISSDESPLTWEETEVVKAIYPEREEVLAQSTKLIQGDFRH